MSLSKPDEAPRKRGRPPKPIERDELIKAVERLFREGGIEAVSIQRTAEEMSVSRATLYRSVPSKEALLGILFRSLTERLDRRAHEIRDTKGLSPKETLERLIRAQVEAAVEMRDYHFVFFGGGWLPSETYDKYRRWRRDYEQIWRDAIKDAMDAGDLKAQDTAIATRLVLGMVNFVSQWYRPGKGMSAEKIADDAISMLEG